jgi:hypothetical protein
MRKMKNTKITKILVMALSLALLIGSAIAFAVSAADDTYAIKSINISHEDSTKVLVAVDAIGVDPATIEVKYTIGAGEAKTAKYYGLVDIYKDGKQYPVSEIAEREMIPQQFAYKILRKLSKAGYVNVTRGAKGGCRLAVDPTEVTLLELVGTTVPDAHRPGPVLALRDLPLPGQVLERVVLGVDRLAVLLRGHRDPVGDRPGGGGALVLEPQVPVQRGGVVLLDDEARKVLGVLRDACRRGLGGIGELALGAVSGETVSLGHRHPGR